MYKMASISINVSLLLPTENDICQSLFLFPLSSSSFFFFSFSFVFRYSWNVIQDKQIDLSYSQSSTNRFAVLCLFSLYFLLFLAECIAYAFWLSLLNRIISWKKKGKPFFLNNICGCFYWSYQHVYILFPCSFFPYCRCPCHRVIFFTLFPIRRCVSQEGIATPKKVVKKNEHWSLCLCVCVCVRARAIFSSFSALSSSDGDADIVSSSEKIVYTRAHTSFLSFISSSI